MRRYSVQDLDANNVADLLTSAQQTLAQEYGGLKEAPLFLQGLVDKASGGIVAYVLPGFDFESVAELRIDTLEDL